MQLSYAAPLGSRRYSQVLVAASLAVTTTLSLARRHTDRDWRKRPLATSLAAAAASKLAIGRRS